MLLTLIRHGETEHNRGQLTLGRADIPLNHRGRLQARAVAASFAVPPAAIYSSSLGRCRDTAQAIALATNTAVVVEPDLIEMDVGEMEHLTREELRSRYPSFLQQWLHDPADARMPGGETLREVQERGWAALERIAAAHGAADEHPAGEVVIVTHNFVILTVTCRALGLPLAGFRRLRVGIASRTSMEVTPAGATVTCLNATDHVRSAGLG